MVWIVGALCMILFGAGLGVIGLSLGAFVWAILGVILVLAGIFLLVSYRSGRTNSRGPVDRGEVDGT
jgi:hypothetical protein